MKRYLKISNSGLLDERLVHLMGGTTKKDNEFKIGQFGSGLKYTVAYCLRNNIDFKIYIGNKEIVFDTIDEIISGTKFSIITINGEKTSITTNMGMDWKSWMIVREIYSNALDEGNATYQLIEEKNVSGQPNITSFFLEAVPNILEVYNNWSKYFIVDKEYAHSTGRYKFYPESGPLRIYKQGILIHEDTRVNSVFNYDIVDASINELREFTGSTEVSLCYALSAIKDKKLIEYLIDIVSIRDSDKEDKYFESSLDLSVYGTTLSDEWQEVLSTIKVIDKETHNKLKGRDINIDLARVIILPTMLYRGLVKRAKENISVVRVSKSVGEFYEIIDEDLTSRIKKAITILENCFYFIHPELEFIIGEFGDKNVLARVDLDKKCIYISQKMNNCSMFQIVAMLIEENEHFNTGYADETRQFQQHFIDLYTRMLLKANKVELL